MALGHAAGGASGGRHLGGSHAAEQSHARVLFVLDGDTMVLLHGFIKKQQKTPGPELDLAKDRLKLLKRVK